MKFQVLWENMTLRSNPLGGEDFVSNLQKDPETTEGEKSGSSPFSSETYVDYHGKYTTKLKIMFPHATDDQIEALLYFKKNGMQKAFEKLYTKLYVSAPEYRRKRLEHERQKYANDPEYRRKRLEHSKQKYDNDPEYRRKKLEHEKQKYANDPEYRRKRLEHERQRKLKKLGTFSQFVQDKNPEV